MERGAVNRRRSIVRFAIFTPNVVTLVLWGLSKDRLENWTPWSLQTFAQITGLIALDLFAICLLIAARSRAIEKIYGGLDKAYHLHANLAKIGFGLMVIHPVLLIPSYLERQLSPALLFWFADFWPRNFGIASYYLFALLVGLTLWKRLNYQTWLLSHHLTGIAFLLAAAHALNAHSDVKDFEPLRNWVWFVASAGIVAWVYKTLFYRRWAAQYSYEVSRVDERAAGIIEIGLRPVGARIHFEPGEFAWLQVENNPEISREPHPFSIASDPALHEVRFAIRQSGDYTRTLSRLRTGDAVRLYGPYGEFTSYQLDEFKKQVWIAGGIGVTPFLSMLRHERNNGDAKSIWFFYSAKTAGDLAYADELREIAAGAEDRLHVILHATDQDGFLDRDRLAREVGPELRACAVLLCGPMPMMLAMKKAVVAEGVPSEHVFFEDFSFR